MLQVFLKGGSSRDRLARILIFVSIGVTGVSHSSGADVLGNGGGSGDLGGGGEGGGGGHNGSDDGELVL